MSHSSDLSLDAWQERSSQILSELEKVDAFRMMDRSDPWNPDSLNAIEQNMLETWSSVDESPTDIHTQYEAFLGEGLQRRFGGSWVKLEPELLGDASDSTPSGLGIKYEETDTIDVIDSLLPFAYRTGTGTWWSSSFQINEQMTHSV